jgi:hypothetical protein
MEGICASNGKDTQTLFHSFSKGALFIANFLILHASGTAICHHCNVALDPSPDYLTTKLWVYIIAGSTTPVYLAGMYCFLWHNQHVSCLFCNHVCYILK